jgi:hypothetical protein
LGRNVSNGSIENLVQIGIRQGTSKLGELLDEIAKSRSKNRRSHGSAQVRRLKKAA